MPKASDWRMSLAISRAELANGLETNLLTIIARHWETEPTEGYASTQGTPDKPFIVVPAALPRALRHPTTSRH